MYKEINTNGMIYDMHTVNTGHILSTDYSDPLFTNRQLVVEAMHHTEHNPNFDILAYYYWDEKEHRKIEVTLYKDINNSNNIGSGVYFFKGKSELHHCHSKNYVGLIRQPEKYNDIVKWLDPLFTEVFNR